MHAPRQGPDPETRFTKADVIDYYIRVAPFILPHLKNRPVTLKRYPDGVTGQAYWDKAIVAGLFRALRNHQSDSSRASPSSGTVDTDHHSRFF
jgi:bifunctional non-homologous end joining protein LigD